MLALPARRAVGGGDEGVGRGRYRGVVEIDPQRDGAGGAPDRDLLDGHRAVAAEQEAQRRRERRLRLRHHDARAEPAKRGDAVADMAADVEHEVAAPDIAGIDRIERGAAVPPAVIDAQRANDPARCSHPIEHASVSAAGFGVPRLRPASAGRPMASSGEGSVSSGSRPRPTRSSQPRRRRDPR